MGHHVLLHGVQLLLQRNFNLGGDHWYDIWTVLHFLTHAEYHHVHPQQTVHNKTLQKQSKSRPLREGGTGAQERKESSFHCHYCCDCLHSQLVSAFDITLRSDVCGAIVTEVHRVYYFHFRLDELKFQPCALLHAVKGVSSHIQKSSFAQENQNSSYPVRIQHHDLLSQSGQPQSDENSTNEQTGQPGGALVQFNS